MLPDLTLTSGGQFGIYIHVPFCATRCGYCDFNTYTPVSSGRDPGRLARGAADRTRAGGRNTAGTHGGHGVRRGGTPSLLGGRGLADVLDAVRDAFTLGWNTEITTEANPGRRPEFFAQLRTAGFTRVSLGMQSGGQGSCRSWIALPAERKAAARKPWLRASRTSTSTSSTGRQGSRRRPGPLAGCGAGAGVDHMSGLRADGRGWHHWPARLRRGEITPVDDDVLARRARALTNI